MADKAARAAAAAVSNSSDRKMKVASKRSSKRKSKEGDDVDTSANDKSKMPKLSEADQVEDSEPVCIEMESANDDVVSDATTNVRHDSAPDSDPSQNKSPHLHGRPACGGHVNFGIMKKTSQYGDSSQIEFIKEINQSKNTPVSSCSDSDDEPFQTPKMRKKRTMNAHLPSPELAEYPIVLEDVGTGNHPRYQQYGQFTNKLFQAAGIAPIRRQRRLAANKWLIHCQTAAAQKALAKTTCLGGVKVKCYIPLNKTVGVVRSVPRSVSMDTIVSDNPKLILSATRLNLRDGTPSQAVKLIFNSKTLPPVMRMGNEMVCVTPYVEPVLRCTKCQRLGHKRANCPAKHSTCARCGQRAHDPDPEKNRTLCTATTTSSFCINCNVHGHSAAWGGCPRRSLQQKASAESARLGIPIGVIIQKMSKEGSNFPIDPQDRDHSYYFRDAPSRPPSPSLPKVSTAKTLTKSFSEAVSETQSTPKLPHHGKRQPITSERTTSNTRTSSYLDQTALLSASAVTATSADTTAVTSIQADYSTPQSASGTVPPTSHVADPLDIQSQLSAMSVWMKQLQNSVSDQLERHSKFIAEKMKSVEELGNSLTDSIVDKLSKRRQEQILMLQEGVGNLTSTHPVSKLLGQCLLGLVQAVELGKPAALLGTLTSLYNASNRGAPVEEPCWNDELSNLASLALGAKDASTK